MEANLAPAILPCWESGEVCRLNLSKISKNVQTVSELLQGAGPEGDGQNSVHSLS